MQEPTNRDQQQKTAFKVLSWVIGCSLFAIVMCAGLVFFLWGLCQSGKIRVELPPAERVVRSGL